MSASIFGVIGGVIVLLLILAFVILLVFGIVKKKKLIIILSIIPLVMVIIAFIVVTFFVLGFHVYNKVGDIMTPRTGMEIYESLFGYSNNDCVKVINYQDQKVPIVDYAIWLHFKTCPTELARILDRNNYSYNKIDTTGLYFNEPSTDNWFNPKLLGDSLLLFEYFKDDYGNMQTIYSNIDSTEVYCIDIYD